MGASIHAVVCADLESRVALTSMSPGMAVRLAFDLGLHVSSRRYVEEGKIAPAEANARNVSIWGCALNDWYVLICASNVSTG